MCLFTLWYDILIASRLVNKLIWYWIQTRREYGVSGCIHVNIKLLYFCIGQSNNLQFSWKFASNELRNTCIYNCCRNKLNYTVRFVILSLIRQHGVNGVKMFSLATLFSHFLLFLKYSNLNYCKYRLCSMSHQRKNSRHFKSKSHFWIILDNFYKMLFLWLVPPKKHVNLIPQSMFNILRHIRRK